MVDDGSTDGSADVLDQFEGVRTLRLPYNQGVGVARRWGTEMARGEVVVWTDCDMTYPNDQIHRLVDHLDGYDQIVGSRRYEGQSESIPRRLAKWIIRRLASYLTRYHIPDLNSGYRAFRKDVAEQFLSLLPRGFSCVTTLTMAFLTNGYSVAYTPIEYQPRSGKSKFHWRSDTRRYALQVIRMAAMWEPLRVFVPISGLLAIVGLGTLTAHALSTGLDLAIYTLVFFTLAFAVALLGITVDVLVQLNRRSGTVLPAARRLSPDEVEGESEQW